MSSVQNLVQVDQLVFKQLVDRQFPRLTSHLDELGVNVASVSTQWFLCIFVNSLPLETCLRVWDIFLFDQSSSVLFRIALALVDIYAQVSFAYQVDSGTGLYLTSNVGLLPIARSIKLSADAPGMKNLICRGSKHSHCLCAWKLSGCLLRAEA